MRRTTLPREHRCFVRGVFRRMHTGAGCQCSGTPPAPRSVHGAPALQGGIMRKTFTRRRQLLAVGAVAALGLALLQTPAAQALPANIFELDGNSADNAQAGEDWDTL